MQSYFSLILNRIFSGSRIYIVAGVVSGIIGLYVKSSIIMYKFYNEVEVEFISVTAIIISVIFLLLAYLQSSSPIVNLDSKAIKDVLKDNKIVSKDELLVIVNELKSEVNQKNILSNKEKESVINDLKKSITNNVTDKFLLEQTAILRETIKKEITTDFINKKMNETKDRLLSEVKNLKLRANLNLIFGIVITCIALYILYGMIDVFKASPVHKNIQDTALLTREFLFTFLPRISLVVFIEFFAYFFLKLYKNGLTEIKFFQNELTNIDAKFISIHAATVLPENDSLKNIIENLMKTERNYILEKGQTTVELERARSDGDVTKSMLESFSIFARKKK